ncbi:ParA family protein [Flavonifractor plautii]|uniref:ParA family protein n=1 Tax=Flavonifractor plautii TaxID=292800 RepID=UPI003EE9E859
MWRLKSYINPEFRILDLILSPVFDGKPEPLSAANCYTFREIPNLFLLPGHIAFSEYDATYNIAENLTGSLAVFQNVPGALRYMLEITAEKYKLDYILLDMSPSISATNANILMQSDYFFIPCAPDYFCYMAIESLSDTFQSGDRPIRKWLSWMHSKRPFIK